jgi:hypothetical protein
VLRNLAAKNASFRASVAPHHLKNRALKGRAMRVTRLECVSAVKFASKSKEGKRGEDASFITQVKPIRSFVVCLKMAVCGYVSVGSLMLPVVSGIDRRGRYRPRPGLGPRSRPGLRPRPGPRPTPKEFQGLLICGIWAANRG